MFDAEYFEKHLVKQFKELGEASVEIHLHNGNSFSVRKFDAEPGYVLMEVFPPDGVNEESKEKRKKTGGTDEVFFDRVAVDYASISHVLLTVTDPENPTKMGF